jgi:hypothetical protein
MILAWKSSLVMPVNEFAQEWITNAVWELLKKKTLHQYKKRKMEIAQNIRLEGQCVSNGH